MAERLKARVAQFHAELILRLGMEAAMTLAAGGVVRPLRLFLNVDTWVNLELDHGAPKEGEGQAPCHNETHGAIEIQRLTHNQAGQLSDLAQSFRQNSLLSLSRTERARTKTLSRTSPVVLKTDRSRLIRKNNGSTSP